MQIELKKTITMVVMGSVVMTLMLIGNPIGAMFAFVFWLIAISIIDVLWTEKEKEVQTTLEDRHF